MRDAILTESVEHLGEPSSLLVPSQPAFADRVGLIWGTPKFELCVIDGEGPTYRRPLPARFTARSSPCRTNGPDPPTLSTR
jgi:hypothetical protein